MKRKVMKVAESSALISLPYKWVRENNINKGDELEVLEKDNSLIISADSVIENKEVEVDITNLDRTTIMYALRSLYRLGFDTVRLNFKSPTTIYQRTGKELSIISVIHSEVNRLVGFEVMQEKDNYCVIKDLQEATYKDFDQVLRRVFLLISDTMEEFISGVKNNNLSVLSSIENRHDTITKFASHCLRLLNKKGKDKAKSANYYHIIASLDRITDIFKYSARDAIEFNKPFSKDTIKILEYVKKAFNLFYQLFYKYNNNIVHEINQIRYDAEKRLKKLNADNIEIIAVSKHFTILEILLDLIEARTALEY